MLVARHEAALRQTDDKGFTTRQHFERLAERGDKRSIRVLEGPEFPYALKFLWEDFLELDSRRRMGFSAYEALQTSDIDSYFFRMDKELERHEFEAILQLDLAIRAPLLYGEEP
jgi:hypothetical protein